MQPRAAGADDGRGADRVGRQHGVLQRDRIGVGGIVEHRARLLLEGGLLVGEVLEAVTFARPQKAIHRLLDQTPRTARVRMDGQELEVPASQVQVGDLVIVHPGERVPVDGPVVAGGMPQRAASTDAAAAAPASSSDQPTGAADAQAPAATTAQAANETAPAAPAPAAAPPPAPGYVVQFGAFSVAGNAQRLADQMNGKGYHANVVAYRDHQGRQIYAVRGEAYDSAAAADAAAKRIRELEGVPTAVVRQRASGAASG